MKKLEARVVGVYIAADPTTLLSAPLNEVEVTFEGFAGDKHSGITMRSDGRTPYYPRGTEIRNSRQISLVSMEELAQIAEAMQVGCIRPEWLGANLAIEGVSELTALPAGTKLFFPRDAALVISSENGPCVKSGQVIQDHQPQVEGLTTLFPKAGLHKRGLVGYVERPGWIAAGDAVQIEIPG